MIWILNLALVLGLAVAVLALRTRRAALESLERGLEERQRARTRGSDRARLEHPSIDATRCIGCGLCVSACPEEGVLDVLHGQAVVVHGARCVGHGRCAEECPVGAIALTLGDLSERRDIPAIDDALEAPGVPGLFLAGEVTGRALVRTAITHGTAVARTVAQRGAPTNGAANGALDLCIVGAGPAGLACALEAKARGLRFTVLERERLGGTVAHYPRQKLVMTQPVELPLHGRLGRTTYTKEELVELWEQVAREQELPIQTGAELLDMCRDEAGAFHLRTSTGAVQARNVCLALGRRGTPRKLGVPGEELPKVAYSLEDARGYAGRRVLVVGGGDSAIEAAVGLAEQPGCEVHLSYRGAAFTRLKARNEARVTDAIARGRIRCLYESRVTRIAPDAVELEVGPPAEALHRRVPNDEVFVFAGGVPPFGLLERAGVSFDPADRPRSDDRLERGTGLVRGLGAALAVASCVLVWVFVFRDYYGLPLEQRLDARWHGVLRPAGVAGLAFGVAATAAMLANLAYLGRRAARGRLALGKLSTWMAAHVATGVLALALVLPHSAMAPRDTVGGHALLGLVVLVATGAVGRYFYAFVPRAANGRELELDEARGRLEALSAEWERDGRDFAERARCKVRALIAASTWRTSLPARIGALLAGERQLRRALGEILREGRREGIPEGELAELAAQVRRAHRAGLAAAHFEDLRGLLASWRYLHRWVALLVVLLVAIHIANALRFAALPWSGGTP